MKIGYIVNAGELSGVGQRAMEIQRRLEEQVDVELVKWYLHGEAGELRRHGKTVETLRSWPGPLGSKSVNWIRLGRRIKREPDAVYHATNQSLSFLAARLQPMVVTVHDIIEVTDPQDARAAWLNRYLYGGIGRADQLIAVSEYTKKQIVEWYGVPEERITVVYNGVNREIFYPVPSVKRDSNMILYVGSEHPRKNVQSVLEVVAQIRKERPEVRLLKVGGPGLAAGRQSTLQHMKQLGLEEAVTFRENVDADELNKLYNEAGVLLFPSRQEGFGLPPLEAMAAGCPVVCSNATSLPEVVGTAALLHEVDDVGGMTGSVLRILNDEGFREDLRTRGLEQAGKFSWDTVASKVLEVYRKLA